MNKSLVLIAFIGSLSILSHCTSDNGEEMELNCNESDLSIQLTSTTDPTCNSAGSISVEASGGKTPYQYAIDESAYSSQSTFEDLNIGEYTLFVMDANECVDSLVVELSSDEAIMVSAIPSGCGNNDGVIEVSATGGNGDFMYALDNGDFQSESVFEGLSAGEYDVTVMDSNECETTTESIKIGSTLSADVMPLVNTNCAISGCHLDSRNPILDDKDAVISNADRIKKAVSEGTMPPSGALPDDEVAAIVTWVDCGAEDN